MLIDVEYPKHVPWNGLVLACYGRSSTPAQKRNPRAQFQLHDLAAYCLGLGYAVKVFDEQAMSAATLTKRRKANDILAEIQAGTIHGIAVADLSRLTRDTRGIDAAYIGDLLVRYAEGRLVIYGREMDLRRAEDWQLYRTLTAAAAWERDEIKRRMFEGLKVVAERVQRRQLDIFVRTHVKYGYKRVYLSDTDGRPVLGANNRVRSTVEKDATCAEGMRILEREFDRQPTLAAVCRALHKAGVRGRWTSAAGSGTWTGEALRCILRDPLYVGEWRLVWTDNARGDVWQRFASTGFDPSQVKRDVPHLAWFDRAKWQEWRGKFLGQKGTLRSRRHNHRLLGIVHCVKCGRPLASQASEPGYSPMYKCPGRSKKVNGCNSPILSEVKMFRALRTILPDVLRETTGILSAVWASPLASGGIEAQLRVVQDRKDFLKQHYADLTLKSPTWLLEEMEELDAAEECLSRQRDAIQVQRDLRLRAVDVMRSMENDPTEAFDLLEPDAQAAVWQTLLSDVRFGATGRTNSLKVWVDFWELTTTARAPLETRSEG